MIIEWKDSIASLRPMEVALYLRARGWRKTFDYDHNYGSIWNLAFQSGEEVEVILPEDQSVRDYNIRMIELFKTLEMVENRKIVSIIHDVSMSGADVVRFRIASNEALSGTIPLVQAASLTRGVEAALLAAACSTITPRSFFPRMTYNEAKDFLNGCRMGQSERGSYIITVLSPVAPPLIKQGSLFPEYEDEDAFERRVLFTLFNGLYQLKSALSTGTGEAVEGTVSAGVSANLCEALTLMQPVNETGELEVSVSWSPVRQVLKQIPQAKVRFYKESFPLISECVKYLRQTAPIEDYELRGFVRRLDSADPDQGGKASIVSIMENKATNIHLDLSAEQYKVAVEAHASRTMFSCKGTLSKESKGYRLVGVTHVGIENEQQLQDD